MTELIITEKPKSAQRIAEALADSKVEKKGKGAPYYELEHKGKKIAVGCAVGHLYGLAEKKKKGWSYPVFEVEWKPLFETDKKADFTKKYFQTLQSLSKTAKKFIIATDYDIEGEVIGLNVVRFICKQKDASRMKFSTLTKVDLVEAYEKSSPHLDWGQAKAGETRHELDWYWGINLSRALTGAIKTAGRFKIMSSGRVQGPALKIIVDREKEIRAFKAVPFWLIELIGKVEAGKFSAWHEKDKFWKKEEADAVIKKTKGKKAFVKDLKKDEFKQAPPTPFDLTTMQMEAYRCLGIQPKDCLEIAQELYTSGLISYPRTSSQILPPALGFAKILTAISKQAEYSALCKKLGTKNLKPNNGKKTDPAHPAIYPTGIVPKKIDGRSKKLYDLVVRRFLATFAEAAVRETVAAKIEAEKEIFVAKGIVTKFRGWHEFYGPYAKFKDEELPKMVVGEEVHVEKIKIHDKETAPPKRYTPASIIKDLEKRNLGTKATRAAIVDTLFQRGYVGGKSIEATELGINTVDTLVKYCPEILDEELTRHFEEEMEDIRENKKSEDSVLKEAQGVIKKILAKFKDKEKNIGQSLIDANDKTVEKESTVGVCPKCKKGTLMMRRGKFGRFIACSEYPNCKTTYKLPSSGLIKPSEEMCAECSYPKLMIIRKAKRPQVLCINPECPSKKVKEETDRKCPDCKGKLVLRKSIYGSFYGCENYPKCRHTERA